MDYNDIQDRLKRTFNSLNDRFDDDIEKHTRIERWGNGLCESWHFGSDDESEILNKVMMILYNLSSLKDHLKNDFRRVNLNPDNIEREINNSIHLQVLMDIVNQDKHRTPLRHPRSDKSLKIIGLSNGMRLADKRTGEKKLTMFIDGTIVDNNNQRIFGLDELVEQSFDAWKTLSSRITDLS